LQQTKLKFDFVGTVKCKIKQYLSSLCTVLGTTELIALGLPLLLMKVSRILVSSSSGVHRDTLSGNVDYNMHKISSFHKTKLQISILLLMAVS